MRGPIVKKDTFIGDFINLFALRRLYRKPKKTEETVVVENEEQSWTIESPTRVYDGVTYEFQPSGDYGYKWVKVKTDSFEIKLPDLPEIDPSHKWGPYGYFGEAKCQECWTWTDEPARGLPCKYGEHP